MTAAANRLTWGLESQLITACARTSISPEIAAQIDQILQHNLDWDYVFTVAGKNGVLPMVSTLLLQRFSKSVPAPVRNRLDGYLKRHTQTNLYFATKLIEIISLFEANGIPILPIKGPSLALQAYGNLALRHFVDLDVLVRPKDFDAAVSLLSSNGYLPTSRANWLRRKALFFTHKKDIVLKSSDSRVYMELHWKLSGSHFSMPFEITQLWNRLDRLPLGGVNALALPFKDQFVYLCLHGSRHEWERLGWICDLNELIQSKEASGTKIDWEEIHAHARNHGCERVVDLGLYLLDEFLAVPAESPNFEKIKANTALQGIAGHIGEKIFSKTRTPTLKKEKYMYLLSLQEKRTHRLRLYLVYLTYYTKLLFNPNSLDKTIFRLPWAFYPLYYILRPLRLVLALVGYQAVEKVRHR